MFAEFLAAQTESEVRHELFGGWVVEMAGGTPAHNLVATAAVAMLRPAARRSGCFVYAADAMLRVGDADAYYPDVMVVCSAEIGERFETSPCLIVEVLSPSTHLVDRNTKRSAYSTIPSLTHYLLVSPDTFSVEAHTRLGHRWTRTVHELGDRISLSCPSTDFTVDELFEDLLRAT